MSVSIPIIYLAPAPLTASNTFDLLFLEASPQYDLIGICESRETLYECLDAASELVNLIVHTDYEMVLELIEQDKAWFRDKVARIFVIGGQAGGFVPIDPRLKERHPKYFAPQKVPNQQDLGTITHQWRGGYLVTDRHLFMAIRCPADTGRE